MLVTVVGQPEGLVLEGTAAAKQCVTFPADGDRLPRLPMALKQSIDQRAAGQLRRGARRAPAKRWRGCARATPTARCRCCGFPRSATTSPPSSATPRCCATAPPTWSFLGTGGSSLGGQTLAQLAGHAVPGVGALRDPPRIHFMDNLDPDSYRRAAAAAAAHDQPLRRGVEVRRHRRDADADHRRARRAARPPGSIRTTHVPRHHRAGQGRQGQRPARSAVGPSASA